jgi:hypothetical protein
VKEVGPADGVAGALGVGVAAAFGDGVGGGVAATAAEGDGSEDAGPPDMEGDCDVPLEQLAIIKIASSRPPRRTWLIRGLRFDPRAVRSTSLRPPSA